jgi:hypothetical protein
VKPETFLQAISSCNVGLVFLQPGARPTDVSATQREKRVNGAAEWTGFYVSNAPETMKEEL